MAKEIIDMMSHGGSASAEYATEDNNFQADFNGDNLSSYFYQDNLVLQAIHSK